MLDILQVLDAISKLGLIGSLGLAIMGGWKQWYLFKGPHDAIVQGKEEVINLLKEDLNDMTEDRDYWRAQAIDALTATKKVVNLAQQQSGLAHDSNDK